MDVRGIAENVDDLEGGRLLPLDAVRVDRVHQGHREVLGQLASDAKTIVEIPEDLNDATAVDDGLGKLASCDLSLGKKHDWGHASPGRVGRRRGRGVARGGTHDCLGTISKRLRHGHRHAPVLEGAGRVGTLDLDPHRGVELGPQTRRRHQRRGSLPQSDDLVDTVHRETVSVILDDAEGTLLPGHDHIPSTRMTRGSELT